MFSLPGAFLSPSFLHQTCSSRKRARKPSASTRQADPLQLLSLRPSRKHLGHNTLRTTTATAHPPFLPFFLKHHQTEYLPGKRATAICLLIYHTVAAGTLFRAPRFIPTSFGELAERWGVAGWCARRGARGADYLSFSFFLFLFSFFRGGGFWRCRCRLRFPNLPPLSSLRLWGPSFYLTSSLTPFISTGSLPPSHPPTHPSLPPSLPPSGRSVGRSVQPPPNPRIDVGPPPRPPRPRLLCLLARHIGDHKRSEGVDVWRRRASGGWEGEVREYTSREDIFFWLKGDRRERVLLIGVHHLCQNPKARVTKVYNGHSSFVDRGLLSTRHSGMENDKSRGG
jgi:hypothetical protein